ncbi:tripartite tricarboxylate transporter substrate binding protein [Roseomonas gilardii subsp. gilardii]|uniref:Bug family tripartite tricarboxylate transporter substrate binding protein n=1 Tax=Roseomonas gilardii TaxID=257708 RepID=UPI001FFBC33C|nr:tripartite tricarboxylate transporter substrate-binding protein [Roseomonas gilardii]UPG73451.1 tripartite tricarboxylate transporter substrate binding protein [Roseomonas gilardii subsp. gilardii]
MRVLPTLTLAFSLGAASLAATAPRPALAAWEPNRPVEFIVTSGAGGGTDLFARTIQAAIQKHDLLNVPVVVTNKGGGSGAEGFVYGRGSQGDPLKVIFGTNNEWLLPYVARVAWKPEQLVPVATMAFDEFMLWVKADAPYKTAADYIAAAREKPGAMKMGGSQTKDTDQILTLKIQKATGVRFTYIPFRGGGEAGVQLAGGHVDSNVNNPSESVGGWRGDQVRPVCVFRKTPLPVTEKVTATQSWADIPTCASQGIPVDEYRMPRTVFLPPDVPKEAQEFWTGVMRKVTETPEWKDYITRTVQSAVFLTPEQMKPLMEEEQKSGKEMFAAEKWLVN